LALLIDPEKFQGEQYLQQKKEIENLFNILLIGGSSDKNHQINNCISFLKTNFDVPVYIFPGSHEQFSPNADGILYLSLISGNNSDYLIGEHIKSAKKIKESKMDVIPTGYILIDGGIETSVQKVSKTAPINQNNPNQILDIATAGELLGMKAIYLEAGSGALNKVNENIIKKVANQIDIPLIVGGGIRNQQDIKIAFDNGANMVVIGTFIEENLSNINQLK
jgi:putative glycerol-1-phosphate prenyltransferase